MLHSLAILCCTPIEDVKLKIQEAKTKQDKIIEEGKENERYRAHRLYKKKKIELEEECKKQNLDFKNKKKHELVKLLLKGQELPEYVTKKISNIPSTLSAISSLPVADLRCILAENGLPTIGVKDELALRVYLKKSHKEDFISRTEATHILEIIKLAQNVIQQQEKILLLGGSLDTVTKRKYDTTTRRAILKKQKDVALEAVFKPLEIFTKSFLDPRLRTEPMDVENQELSPDGDGNTYERFFNIGAKIKVFWEKEAVKELGWRGGWYVAHVTSYSREDDRISVQFVSERKSIYDIEVASSLANNTLTLA